MPQKQTLSLGEKVEIIEEYLNGNMGLREAARKVGVVPNTISQ